MKPLLLFLATLSTSALHSQPSPGDTVQLHRFDERMATASLICLGETGHGFESINRTKAAVVHHLRRRTNTAVIAFESSFTQSVVAFYTGGSLERRAESFLYPFWNTESVQACLAPFADAETETPRVVGFDVQEDCRFHTFSRLLVDSGWVSANRDIMLEADSILSFYIGDVPSRLGPLSVAEYERLMTAYNAVQAEMETGLQPSLKRSLLLRGLQNRTWLCRSLTLATAQQKMRYRDSLMAENIRWLKDSLYPTEGMVIWSADTHVAKGSWRGDPVWMGERLSAVYGESYVSVSFRRGTRGEPFLGSGTSYRFSTDPQAAFDAVVYIEELKKIAFEQWRTPCGQHRN